MGFYLKAFEMYDVETNYVRLRLFFSYQYSEKVECIVFFTIYVKNII